MGRARGWLIFCKHLCLSLQASFQPPTYRLPICAIVQIKQNLLCERERNYTVSSLTS